MACADRRRKLNRAVSIAEPDYAYETRESVDTSTGSRSSHGTTG